MDKLTEKKNNINLQLSDVKKEIKEEERRLYNKEQDERINLKKQIDYERFIERPKDAVIGHAHYDYGYTSYSTYGVISKTKLSKFERHSPFVIVVKGRANEEKRYYTPMELCHTTLAFFEKMWTDEQRTDFKRKLNALVRSEIRKILKNPLNMVELLGVANTQGWNVFPNNKKEKAKLIVQEEQFKILDKMDMNELIEMFKEHKLKYGRSLLNKYLVHKNRL